MTTTLTVGSGKQYANPSTAFAAIPLTLADDYTIEIYSGVYTDIIGVDSKIYGGATNPTYSIKFTVPDGENVDWDAGGNLYIRAENNSQSSNIIFEKIKGSATRWIYNVNPSSGIVLTIDRCDINCSHNFARIGYGSGVVQRNN